jgi:hypothetical protein
VNFERKRGRSVVTLSFDNGKTNSPLPDSAGG